MLCSSTWPAPCLDTPADFIAKNCINGKINVDQEQSGLLCNCKNQLYSKSVTAYKQKTLPASLNAADAAGYHIKMAERNYYQLIPYHVYQAIVHSFFVIAHRGHSNRRYQKFIQEKTKSLRTGEAENSGFNRTLLLQSVHVHEHVCPLIFVLLEEMLQSFPPLVEEFGLKAN